VTPSNQSLILNLIDYLSHTKHVVDTVILDLFCKIVRMMMAQTSSSSEQNVDRKKIRRIFDFSKGFPDPERAHLDFEKRFYHGVETILGNKYLPIRYHSLIR